MDDDEVETRTITFRASAPELVATSAQRRAAGLHHWVDGTMGVVRRHGRTLVIAPNGRNLSRHETAVDADLLQCVVDNDQPILGCPPDVAHASGGPLLLDDASGALILVYHGETFVDGDHDLFFSFLGLAISRDDGATFADLGRIVTSDLPEDDLSNRPVELGPGAIARVGDHLHVYFTDRSVDSQRLRLGVARAPFDEVVAAAVRGEAPVFQKFHAGAFDSPGIGGLADDLLRDRNLFVGWFDVARLAEPDVLVLIVSTVPRWSFGDHRWFHYCAHSHDGVSWSTPVPLYDEGVDGEMLYLTIDSGGAEQSTVDGREFDLYRVVSTTPYRWDDARVERVRVSWVIGDEPSNGRRVDRAMGPR